MTSFYKKTGYIMFSKDWTYSYNPNKRYKYYVGGRFYNDSIHKLFSKDSKKYNFNYFLYDELFYCYTELNNNNIYGDKHICKVEVMGPYSYDDMCIVTNSIMILKELNQSEIEHILYTEIEQICNPNIKFIPKFIEEYQFNEGYCVDLSYDYKEELINVISNQKISKKTYTLLSPNLRWKYINIHKRKYIYILFNIYNKEMILNYKNHRIIIDKNNVMYVLLSIIYGFMLLASIIFFLKQYFTY